MIHLTVVGICLSLIGIVTSLSVMIIALTGEPAPTWTLTRYPALIGSLVCLHFLRRLHMSQRDNGSLQRGGVR